MEIRLSIPNGSYLPIIADGDIPLLVGLDFMRRERLLLYCLTNETLDLGVWPAAPAIKFYYYNKGVVTRLKYIAVSSR